MNILEVEGTELDESCLWFIIDIARPTISIKKLIADINNDCVVFNKKIRRHKNLELKDCLPFDQDISEIAIAYIKNLIVDHTPKNLTNIARD